MPNLTKKLRDMQALRLEVEADIAQMGLPPGTTPEQLAKLVTQAYEEGFTTGMNRKRGPKPGIKTKTPKTAKTRRKKAKPSPKRAAKNLYRRTRTAILKALGTKSLTRGQIATAAGLDPELVSTCLHKGKGSSFVETPGNRWKANPEIKKEEAKLAETRQKGRKAVANGERPTFRDAIAKVMGRQTLSPGEIKERLEAKGLAPESKNLAHYISFTLSHYKDTFERVARGRYKVARKK